MEFEEGDIVVRKVYYPLHNRKELEWKWDYKNMQVVKEVEGNKIFLDDAAGGGWYASNLYKKANPIDIAKGRMKKGE